MASFEDSGELKIITMSTLGKKGHGRFANQLFQYAFLKTYAKKYNLEVRTPHWIGQYLFGHKESPMLDKLPLVKETTNDLANAVIPNAKRRFENVNFAGFFQYNTKYYVPQKEYFRSLFKPVPEIEKQMNQAMDRLRSKGKTVVGLHLRRGDYGRGPFFIAPSLWYNSWLQDLWPTLNEPVLFIASDEPKKVLGDFAQYNPVTTKDLNVHLPRASYYPDFYILSKCDIAAISNSSYSFLACMLNEQGKLYYRPRLSTKALILFDPWNSEVIFCDEKVSDPLILRDKDMNKIYVIPVNPEFQPKTMNHRYPPHNSYYNMEEDFLVYLNKHPELLTDNPNEADWHYLSIFWNNWLVLHDHAKRDLYKLQDEVNRCIIDDGKTFTICRYADGPVVQTGKMVQFLCSRKTQVGFDIPNICTPHKAPAVLPEKKYLASFAGQLQTHKIRIRMARDLKSSQDILIANRASGENYFVQTMLESYIALSPRGYGGSSFRFYEAMQLGIVPFLIGDIDHRPFKKYIDWSKISFYAPDEKGLEEKLRKIGKQQAIEMGVAAKKVWEEELNYQKWCEYVLKELENR